MGVDLSTIFGDAENAAKQGMTDALNTGGNSAIGYMEQQAVSVLQADQAQHQQAAQQAVTDILKRPTTPGSFSAYFQSLASQPIIKQYGVYIMAGVAVIALVTWKMR